MKNSLKWQITGIFSVLLISILLVSHIFTNFFAEDFFLGKSKKQLLKIYHTTNILLENVDVDDNGKIELNSKSRHIYRSLLAQCSTYNVSLCVISRNSDVVISPEGNNGNLIKNQLFAYLLDENRNQTEILENKKGYIIQKSHDDELDTDYVEMIGSFKGGYVFLMRTAIEGIKQNAAISNQFILFSFLMILPVSLILISIISKKVTSPVIRLSEISQKMANLEFDEKFEGNENNEIGLLGKNMNIMQDTLEETISELKKANITLQSDIEQRELSDKKKSEFIADVSHELKTPIALIQGYAEGLAECINDDEASREFYCEVIIDEANKMNKIVKQLIDLGRLESQRDNIDYEYLDLDSMVKNTISSHAYVIKDRKIKLNYVCDKNAGHAWGDEFKIEEVITNYLTNAIDHTSGDNVIDIHLKVRDDKVRFEIFNTGSPIPEDAIDKIWDKFFKVDKARNRQYGGTGIGLSIVKAIMSLHNNLCGVQNFDNGVMFWFELDKTATVQA